MAAGYVGDSPRHEVWGSVLTARRLLRSPAYAIGHPRYGFARHSKPARFDWGRFVFYWQMRPTVRVPRGPVTIALLVPSKVTLTTSPEAEMWLSVPLGQPSMPLTRQIL